MSIHNSVHNTPRNFDDEDIHDHAVTLISKLDLSNALHLHPNDFVALTVISVKLKGDLILMRFWENNETESMLFKESHRVVSSYGSGTSQRYQSFMFNSSVGNRNNAQKPQASATNSRPSNVTRPQNSGSVGNENRKSNGGSSLNFNKRFINKNNYVGSSFTSFSDDQISKLISLIKENSLNSTGKGVQANMAGANQHLTYTDKDLVNVIDISYPGITVSHPNRTKACITKVGNMVLNKTLTLYDVLVVLKYCVSLMFVHKVARDNNLIVAFDESKCFVLPQDLRDIKVLGIGN
ncbi:hypothetical protein Tco_0593504 [Tanacetum coccineum]